MLNADVSVESVRRQAQRQAEQVLAKLSAGCRERLDSELGFLLKTAAGDDRGATQLASALESSFLPGLLATWLAVQPEDQVATAVMTGFAQELLREYQARTAGNRARAATRLPGEGGSRANQRGRIPAEPEPEPEPELDPAPPPAVTRDQAIEEHATAHIYSVTFPSLLPKDTGWGAPPRRVVRFLKDGRVCERQPDGAWAEVTLSPLNDQQLRTGRGPPAWRGEIQSQVVATTLAEVFNARCSECPPIHCGGRPYVLQMVGRNAWFRAQKPEPRGSGGIRGRLSSSSAHAQPADKQNAEFRAAAFSHLTFEASAKRLVVCGGVGGSEGGKCVVHTCDGKGFGSANKGREGIRSFLRAHTCNQLCTAMNLPRLAAAAEVADQIPLPPGWEEIEQWHGASGGCFLDHNSRMFQPEDPRFQPGDKVEYASSTHDKWLAAVVKRSNPDGTVSLDLRDDADPSRIRRVVAPALLQRSGRARLESGHIGERVSATDDTSKHLTLKRMRPKRPASPVAAPMKMHEMCSRIRRSVWGADAGMADPAETCASARDELGMPAAAGDASMRLVDDLIEIMEALELPHGHRPDADAPTPRGAAGAGLDVTGLWLCQGQNSDDGAEEQEFLWLEQTTIGGVLHVHGRDADADGRSLADPGDQFTCDGQLKGRTLSFLQSYPDGVETQWSGTVRIQPHEGLPPETETELEPEPERGTRGDGVIRQALAFEGTWTGVGGRGCNGRFLAERN